MGWYMPSWGRPDRLRALLDAPGGMPDAVTVICNEDDPAYPEYWRMSPWPIELIPAGSRMCAAWRHIHHAHRDDDFIGWLADDIWPRTVGWWRILAAAAEDRYVAYANGRWTEFPLMRTHPVIGGGLVRAVQLIPDELVAQYPDVVIADLAEDHGLLRPHPDVWVDHPHYKYGSAPVDDTNRRSIEVADRDAQFYAAWRFSLVRQEMNAKVRAFLAG